MQLVLSFNHCVICISGFVVDLFCFWLQLPSQIDCQVPYHLKFPNLAGGQPQIKCMTITIMLGIDSISDSIYPLFGNWDKEPARVVNTTIPKDLLWPASQIAPFIAKFPMILCLKSLMFVPAWMPLSMQSQLQGYLVIPLSVIRLVQVILLFM